MAGMRIGRTSQPCWTYAALEATRGFSSAPSPQPPTHPTPPLLPDPAQESLAEQLEEGYRQAIWVPSRGRLAAQPGGGTAARLELSSHVERGLYALFASGGQRRREGACLVCWGRPVGRSCPSRVGGPACSACVRCAESVLRAEAAVSCLSTPNHAKLLRFGVVRPDGSSSSGWSWLTWAFPPAAGQAAADSAEATWGVGGQSHSLFSPASCPLTPAEDEAWLCQETGWAWLRRIGASSTAGQLRLRLRRGYEEPTSKVGGLWPLHRLPSCESRAAAVAAAMSLPLQPTTP